ncbi:retrotransposon protein [Cucumis melo var. makuwa]|uniref:Retrotransposon protein n=1 Tax=Cucumis melo var. makuwa TaxID=1194695 RepID=A0A5D3E267_CUCMM|nr:retrotransposon protein [Cucumis melo var. makuwa]
MSHKYGTTPLSREQTLLLTTFTPSMVSKAKGFLSPYRGQRYHVQEWRGAENAPTTLKEFFNMKHSSVRNVIELWPTRRGTQSIYGRRQWSHVSLIASWTWLTWREGGRWRSDNVTFRPGYLPQLVRMMGERMPGCTLTSITVIESKTKLLKRTIMAIVEIQGPTCSGFGWHYELKCIIAAKDVFDSWARTHLACKGLLNKPFPHYDELSYVFEKDRTTGASVEMFTDIGSNVPGESDGVQAEDGLDMEFPTMCSLRMNVSLEDRMGARPSMSTVDRMGSSGSKRKRRGQFETVDVFRDAMHISNDQLRDIA